MINYNRCMPEGDCYTVSNDYEDHKSVKFRCHSPHKKPKPCPCPPWSCHPGPGPSWSCPPGSIPSWSCPPGQCSQCPCFLILCPPWMYPPTGPPSFSPSGDPQEVFTETSAFAASTGGPEIDVIETGTLIPLPDAQTLGDITVDATNTEFTVPEDGRYYISYGINLEDEFLLGSRILINSVGNLASQIDSVLEVSSFYNSIIVPLATGDIISLQLFGSDVTVTLQTGAGAILSIIRLDDSSV